ncbi:MAG TPA: alginate lyase family protein [Candidatus Sulfotelmatobacter sp.]|nr:alginate lyase family protein [Candidatus Sulfotelmatobacter sp.]
MRRYSITCRHSAALWLLVTTLMVATSLVAAPDLSEPPDQGAKPCAFDGIPHPRVLVTEQRLEFLRRDIQTNSVRRAIFEKDIQANADRWLHRTIVIPEQGGWGHDFCGPDGVLLELPASQQFDPNIPSPSPTTGKSYISPKILAARRYFEHLWLSLAVRDLTLSYAVTERPEYAAKAAEILLKYADAYPNFIAEKRGFGFHENSLNEAFSLIPQAQGYDLIYNSGALTDEQKRHIEHDFLWPEAQRLIQAGGLGGNWGSWHLSAVGAIGYATGHQRFADYAVNSFKQQISTTLGDDGLWPESIQTYHFYPLDGFLSLAVAAGNCGADLFDWRAQHGKGIEAMFESPLRYMYPTLQLPAINDGWYDAFLPEDQYTVAYWHYQSPEFAWAIHRSEEIGRSGVTGDFYDQRYRLFLFGEKLPDAISAPLFTSTNFPGLGIAILRQGSDVPIDREMFLTFHYGRFLGHGHYDKMGITLFGNGQPLAAGLGTPGYGSPNIRFFGEVMGHNTIATDDENQPRTTDSDLLAFRDDPQFKLAAAETTQSPPGTKWIRAVVLADNYAVVWDNLQGQTNHTFDWFFHAFGDKLAVSGTTASRPATTRRHGEFRYPFITAVRAQQLTGSSIEANWTLPDNAGLKVWLMGEPNDSLFTARCPTADGKTIPIIVLRKKGADCQFLSVLEPWKNEPGDLQISTDQISAHHLRVTVKRPGRTDAITFSPADIQFDFDEGGPGEKPTDVKL